MCFFVVVLAVFVDDFCSIVATFFLAFGVVVCPNRSTFVELVGHVFIPCVTPFGAPSIGSLQNKCRIS